MSCKNIQCCLQSKITPAIIRNQYLYGIPLQPGANYQAQFLPNPVAPWDDANIQYFIDLAYDFVEQMYDIAILAREVKNEQHDYYRDMAERGFFKMALKKSPIIYDVADFTLFPIDLKAIFSASSAPFEYPPDWLRVYPHTGSIHVYPTFGSTGPFLIANNALSFALTYGRSDFIPAYHRISYVAGMCPIPKSVNSVVAKVASVHMLSILGMILFGPISSQSVSIDGISESLSTTVNSQSGAYGPRIAQYQKELEMEFALLRGQYNQPKIIGF